MKLAYFVDEFPPFFRGGLGTYAMEITKEYIRTGNEVTVFSRNTGNDPTKDDWNGVNVHRPKLMNLTDVLSVVSPGDVQRWDARGQQFFTETLLYNMLSASKLVNSLVAVEKKQYDIAVSHDWLAFLAGIVTKSNLGLPLVVHYHSTEQGRTGSGSAAVKDIERLAAMKADLIVTVSYAMRDELVKLGYPEQKIRVVYNGVDTDKYRPDLYSPAELKAFREKIGVGDSPMIFFVGRLTWVKGADTLTMAMKEIAKEVPDAKLVILGKGEQESMLKQIVSSNSLEENVIFNFSYVPEEERLKYYAACDVAIFPSKYEPFGIVSLEAMAMGKPVIVGATGTSGFREQVIPFGPNICGFHINPHDPGDVAKFTIILLKDPELRKSMGINARRHVLESFTWDMAAKNTLRVYDEAIELYKKKQQALYDSVCKLPPPA
ncbi:MAG TPA: glycosyltransferase family 4 protein [Methanocella sp.]|uniref:glycosyltransferase family 4 protein n=1 Tax=Methanocella sp. TaxID=2052833 RepID=UPI002B833610|nr:glycosyltransferase family 4 protein [Methanocella sp.]HTY91284.1 glycosyltransferase family 4 protein [Methanocella sp.]